MITTAVTTSGTTSVLSKREFHRIAAFVCIKEKVRKGDFSFVVVTDVPMRKMNKKFLHHDFVTDVITFPLEERYVSAEIYINGQQARRQAKEYNISQKNEMTRLSVHGILHALGYDDTTAAQRKKMELVQERYVAELSLNK